jgi:hypothetical protein
MPLQYCVSMGFTAFYPALRGVVMKPGVSRK